MAGAEEKIWFVYITDHHEGPFSLAEVEQRLAKREVTKDSLAWKDGMGDWLPISSLPELSKIAQQLEAQGTLKDHPTYMTVQFTNSDQSLALQGEGESLTSLLDKNSASNEKAVEFAQLPESVKVEPDMSLAQRLAMSQQQNEPSLALDTSQESAPASLPEEPAGNLTLDLDTPPAPPTELAIEPTPAAEASGAPAKKINEAKTQVSLKATTTGSLKLGLKTEKTKETTKENTKPELFDEAEVVWTIKSGQSVSGLYSYEQIRTMVANNQLPADYQLWREGWAEFRSDPYANTTAAKPQAKQSTSKKIKLNPMPQAPAGAVQESSYDPQQEDETNEQKPKGWKQKVFGALEKIKLKSKNLNIKNIAQPIASTPTTPTTAKTGKMEARKVPLPWKKIIIYSSGFLLIVGIAGAFYMGLFSGLISSFPDIPDIASEEYSNLKQAAKKSEADGIVFAAAKSKEDHFNPLLYVATNAPEGTVLHLQLKGVTGTLINKISYSVELDGAIDNHRVVKFGPLGDEGKPLPMGDYIAKITAKNSPSSSYEYKFFAGPDKGPAYERRMQKYQENLQKNLDAELETLKQSIQTVVGTENSILQKITMMNSGKKADVVMGLWEGFATETNTMLDQLNTKVQDASAPKPNTEVFYPVYFQNITKFISLLKEKMKMIGENIQNSGTPGGEFIKQKELNIIKEGLEKFSTQMVSDKPIAILTNNIEKGIEWSWLGGSPPADTAVVETKTVQVKTMPTTPAPEQAPQQVIPESATATAPPAETNAQPLAEAESAPASAPAVEQEQREPATAPAPIAEQSPTPTAAGSTATAPVAPPTAKPNAPASPEQGFTPEEMKILDSLQKEMENKK